MSEASSETNQELYTVDQAVKDVYQWLLRDEENLKFVRDAKSTIWLFSELNGNVGRYVRNHFGLWKKKLENDMHPDDFSFEVIDKVRALLKQDVKLG